MKEIPRVAGATMLVAVADSSRLKANVFFNLFLDWHWLTIGFGVRMTAVESRCGTIGEIWSQT